MVLIYVGFKVHPIHFHITMIFDFASVLTWSQNFSTLRVMPYFYNAINF